MIAQLRHRLNGATLLYSLLLGSVLLVYVASVYAGVLFVGLTLSGSAPGQPASAWQLGLVDAWWVHMVAFFVSVLTVVPVYRWVQAGVFDVVYSQAETPHPALAQLNRELDAAHAPHAILPTIVATIAQTLKLPFVEIETRDQGAPMVTTWGAAPAQALVERLPLLYHDTALGELRVCARRWNEPLPPADLHVLRDLARQVGITLYAAQLTTDLQQARERLVLSREEERRRIRNDLHDGLGPTLSSLQLQLGALRTLLRRDPDAAEALINELRNDLRQATGEIRRLVYALRPPLLDELGLAGALKSYRLDGATFTLTCEVPEPMPRLPAAVEVAAFRIASEALQNVLKHAQASACTVTVAAEERALVLAVVDNGCGLPADYQPGVGLRSMEERAAELGGTLRVLTGSDGGTAVIAHLPLPA